MDTEKEKLVREVAVTRESLSRKIEELGEAVNEVVSDAKDSIDEVVDDVTAKAQHLTPRYQVQEHPIAAAFVSVLGGLCFGSWMARKVAPYRLRGSQSSSQVPKNLPVTQDQSTSRLETLLSYLGKEFGPELSAIKGVALTVAVKKLADLISTKQPQFSDSVREIEDRLLERFQGNFPRR